MTGVSHDYRESESADCESRVVLYFHVRRRSTRPLGHIPKSLRSKGCMGLVTSRERNQLSFSFLRAQGVRMDKQRA